MAARNHNSNRPILAIFLLFVILILIFILTVKPFPEKKQTMDVNTTQKQIMKEVQSAKEYAKKTQNWIDNGQDNIYVEHHSNNKSSEEKKVDDLKYFVVGLLQHDSELFSSSISTETLSRDLFKSNNPNKDEVLDEIMSRITRNGKLDGIQYAVDKGAFNSEKDVLNVTLSYKDQKSANIKLQVKEFKDAHTSSDSYYVIETSTWSIINTIEKSMD